MTVTIKKREGVFKLGYNSKICPVCNTLYKIKPSRYLSSKTCSVKCSSLLNTVTRNCRNCGSSYKVPKSRENHNRGSVCSKKCQYELVSKLSYVAEAHTSNYCLGCGGYFEAYLKGTRKKGYGKYCSLSCRTKYRVKELHPQYLHGHSEEKRGNNWQAQKRAAKQRDNHTCQQCNIRAEDLECAQKVLHVHHIIPYRFFDDYLKANDLSNLVTLCPPCHRVADSEIQKLSNKG